MAPTAARRVVLGALCLAATIAYIQRNALSVLESTIREDLQLTRVQMGLAMGAFFWTYAVFQIPSGWVGQRWGSRRSLTLFCAVWSGATAMAALAATSGTTAAAMTTPEIAAGGELDGFARMLEFAGAGALLAWLCLVLSRLIGGAAQAGIFPCSSLVIAEWYPRNRRASVSAWIAAFQQAGAVAAALMTGALLVWVGWRDAFVLFSLPGLIWAWWFFAWFRDRPEDHPGVNDAELAMIREETGGAQDGAQSSGPTPWQILAASPQMWWICTQQFFRACGYIFYASWFPTFLQETHGITVGKSALLTALPLLAALFGSLAGGLLSDAVLVRTGSRRLARQGVAIAGLLSCAAFIFLAYFLQDGRVTPLEAVLLISAGSFCAAAAGPIGYATTIDMGGRHVATVFATMNMAGNIGGLLFPVMVPFLVGEPAAGASGDWSLVLIVFGGVYIAAALCWTRINPEATVFDRHRAGAEPA